MGFFGRFWCVFFGCFFLVFFGGGGGEGGVEVLIFLVFFLSFCDVFLLVLRNTRNFFLKGEKTVDPVKSLY